MLNLESISRLIPVVLLLTSFRGMNEARAAEAKQADGFARGPYVSNVTPDGATLFFELDEARQEVLVRYGTAGKTEEKRLAAGQQSCAVRLGGLAAGTEYRYEVSCGGSRAAGQFSTPPAGAQPFRFVAYGDTRSNPDVHGKVADAIAAEKPAFVLHTGDFVGDGTVEALWRSEFFGPTRGMLRAAPIFPVLGNHENNSELFYRYFGLPKDKGWQSFRWGNAEFFLLDTNVNFSEKSEQRTWLEEQLAKSTATWKIVAEHHPGISCGPHGFNNAVLKSLRPLYEKYGVDVVFAGHDHLYERTQPIASAKDKANRPVTYIVTGAGGAPLYQCKPGPWDVVARSAYHYVVVEVRPDSLRLTAKQPDGEVIDAFSLAKDDPKAAARTFPHEKILTSTMVNFALNRLNLGRVRFGDRLVANVRMDFVNPLDEQVSLDLAWTGLGEGSKVEPARTSLVVPAHKNASAEFAFSLQWGPDSYNLRLDTDAATPYGLFAFVENVSYSVKTFRDIPCVRTAAAPKVDGILDDAAWGAGKPCSQFLTATNSGFAPQDTRAVCLFDGRNLYLGLKLSEPQPQAVRAMAGKHDDDAVLTDDNVQVTIIPDLDANRYFRFGLSAGGVLYEASADDKAWDADWQAKTVIDRNAWTAEIAIPLESVGVDPAHLPEGIGFNILRNDTVRGVQSEITPTFGTGARPDLLGRLRFAEPGK